MFHQPTLRVTTILETVSAHNGELTMSEIARMANIPRGTIMPILQTLCGQHFLSMEKQSKRYYIGLRCFLSGASFANTSGAYSGVASIVNMMARETEETAHFCILEKGDVLYVVKAESTHQIRMYSEIGRKLPAYGTAVGKALLSDMSLEELNQLYPDGLSPLTEHTIRDVRYLYDQLQQVKQTGFAHECEESNIGIRCIATPIRYNGSIVAAISIVIPLFRYDEEKRCDIERILTQAANSLENIIPLTDILNKTR